MSPWGSQDYAVGEEMAALVCQLLETRQDGNAELAQPTEPYISVVHQLLNRGRVDVRAPRAQAAQCLCTHIASPQSDAAVALVVRLLFDSAQLTPSQGSGWAATRRPSLSQARRAAAEALSPSSSWSSLARHEWVVGRPRRVPLCVCAYPSPVLPSPSSSFLLPPLHPQTLSAARPQPSLCLSSTHQPIPSPLVNVSCHSPRSKGRRGGA
jgi:hypothetical protein